MSSAIESGAASSTGAREPQLLRNYVGGRWTPSRAAESLDVHNPATGATIARTPLSTREDVDAAVEAAQARLPRVARHAVVVRARALFRFRNLLEEHFEELARIVTTEHGKTLDESRGSVRRGIENVEVACGAPVADDGLRRSRTSPPASTARCIRQPIGVFAAIAPFNFPAMVPLWFLPFAIATGNTFVVKPSEQVPLSQTRIFELLERCDLPPGVVNLVNGGREVVERDLRSPRTSRACRSSARRPWRAHVYQRATHAGKRVQALGGAKNFVVVMPDADMDRAIADRHRVVLRLRRRALPRRQRGRARRRRAPRGARPPRRSGAGRSRSATASSPASRWARSSARSTASACSATSRRASRRARSSLLDGRGRHASPGRENGYFVGPTIFDDVTPEMTIGREEIFGPVASIMPVQDARRGDRRSCTRIRTPTRRRSSRRAARRRASSRGSRRPSMVGVNIGVAAPMAYFPFGGAKDSFFGDLKAHGRDAFEFYTDKKVVISRWF